MPASGKSYIPLPNKLSNTKAIVNIMNNDNRCFKWAVTRALNPVKDHAYRVNGELRKQSELINWTDIVFSCSFEKLTISNIIIQLLQLMYMDMDMRIIKLYH